MSQQYRNVSSVAVSQIQDHAEMKTWIGKHVFDWVEESYYYLAFFCITHRNQETTLYFAPYTAGKDTESSCPNCVWC